MENFRFIKIKTYFLIGGALFVFPSFVFGYDITTHAALTQEIVNFYDASFPEHQLDKDNKESVMKGSVDEDDTPRYLHHFYDPVYHRGLTIVWDENANKKTGLAFILNATRLDFQSSKDWAEDTKNQGGLNRLTAGTLTNYFAGAKDYSWERGIYEYAWGDKTRGLESLGHILHLLEDASVPEHTRNDIHPPYFHWGSPYELWAGEKFKPETTSIKPTEKPIILTALSDYFDAVAKYSNNNFFSKDTTPDKNPNYTNPTLGKITTELLTTKTPTQFVYDSTNQYRLALTKFDAVTDKPDYFLNDDDFLVLQDYWSHLSNESVIYGAGVVKLFFDEVEKEKETRTLYNKNRSWLAKEIDRFRQGAFSLAGILYGTSVENADLQTKETPVSPAIPPAESVAAIKTATMSPQPIVTQPLPIATTTRENSGSESKNENPVVMPQTPQSSNTSPDLPIAGGTGTVHIESAATESNASSSTPIVNPPYAAVSISECGSLAANGCLVATTSLTITWSSTSTNVASFTVACQNGTSACAGFSATTTTATSTTFTASSDNASYTFSVYARDSDAHTGNTASTTVEIATRPLVINEIAWAGTSASRSADEWIELFNSTGKTVNLAGFVLRSATDNTPFISLTGSIASHDYTILERTDDNTISNQTAHQTYAGALDNTGEQLELSYASTTIDKTPTVSACSGWCGGDASAYTSMERVNPRAAGDDTTNWGTFQGFLPNGKNADGLDIQGTPGKRNSLNYLITKSGSLGQNMTLAAAYSPYLVTNQFVVSSGATLTVEPGTVIKFYNSSSGLTVDGVLKTQGTSSNKIIFTSFKDDTYGGDMNQDGSASSPSASDWRAVRITADGSIINNAIVRYAGIEDGSNNYWANIHIKNASTTITNSTIEYSRAYGLWFENASGTIDSNTIQYNNHNVSGETIGTGIIVTSNSPAITNNQFKQNNRGLQLGSGATPAITGNTFSQNISEAIFSNGSHPTALSGNTASSNGVNGISIQDTISADYTLSNNLPYLIQNTTFDIQQGHTLTIPAGTIIKLTGNGKITVEGKIIANGTADNKVVFTSSKDDTYGSDLNGDGSASTPAAGDWNNIYFNTSDATSTLSNILVRYGGDTNLLHQSGVLLVENSSINLQNSTVENNYVQGVWLKNSTSSAITDSTIQHHTSPSTELRAGLVLVASSPSIKNTTFNDNNYGVYADGSSSVVNLGGIVFTNNGASTSPSNLIP